MPMNRVDKTITVTEAGLRSALSRHRDRNGKHRCPQCVLPHDTLDGAMKCMASHALPRHKKTCNSCGGKGYVGGSVLGTTCEECGGEGER